MVKYDANREIMNTYENLQIVWSQFFTNKVIFGLIWISIGFRYSDLLPTNTNEELFGHIWLFIIFDHISDEG